MKIRIVLNEKEYNCHLNQEEQKKMAAHLRSNDILEAVSTVNEHTIFVNLDAYMILKGELVIELLSSVNSSIKEILKQQESFCLDMAEILKKIQH